MHARTVAHQEKDSYRSQALQNSFEIHSVSINRTLGWDAKKKSVHELDGLVPEGWTLANRLSRKPDVMFV